MFGNSQRDTINNNTPLVLRMYNVITKCLRIISFGMQEQELITLLTNTKQMRENLVIQRKRCIQPNAQALYLYTRGALGIHHHS
jgi:hypothetical protein